MRRSGIPRLTIDAVAAEATLGKGGVLHHYASGDALIPALAARKLEEIRADVATRGAPGRRRRPQLRDARPAALADAWLPPSRGRRTGAHLRCAGGGGALPEA
jgi:AcrR family transcriptional regulator